MAENNPSVFVCYATPDRAWARWVCSELRLCQLRVDVDLETFDNRAPVPQLNESLERADLVVGVVSRRFFEPDRWTNMELGAAVDRWRKGEIALVLVVIDEVSPPGIYGTVPRVEAGDRSEDVVRRLLFGKLREAGICDADVLDGAGANPERYPGPTTSTRLRMLPIQAELLQDASPDVLELMRVHESLDGMTIEVLSDTARSLARGYNFTPPVEVLRRANELAKQTTDLLDVRRVLPGTAIDLWLIRGQIAGLQSYALLDLGYSTEALSRAQFVRYCGQAAGHHELMAWGVGTTAMIWRFDKQFDKSIELANEALEKLVLSGAARARLHAQNMLGYSEIGDEALTISELESCEALVGQEAQADMRDGILSFPISKFHYYAGIGLISVSDSLLSAGIDHTNKAIEMFSSSDVVNGSKTDELLAYSHLATGLLKAEELEAIPEALEPLFRSETPLRTAWHVQWLRRLSEDLGRYPGGAPVVASEVAARVDTFISEVEDSAEADQ